MNASGAYPPRKASPRPLAPQRDLVKRSGVPAWGDGLSEARATVPPMRERPRDNKKPPTGLDHRSGALL